MRMLAGVAFACVLAAPAAAQVADKLAEFLPAKVGEKACFTRVYDAKHLAAHPQQRVTQMTFLMRVVGIGEGGDWVLKPGEKYARLNYQFAMSVMRRGDRKAMTVSGYCPSEARSVQCMRECDGGGVALEKIVGASALMIRLDQNGILLGGCEESKDGWLKAGADDKAFRVEKVSDAQCAALQKEEFEK